ncbi:hypothetical protein FZEAL_7144 [Fusarium zealandicum]|uniref:Xylanolytic transcriptional activator regulatory domain-containing protein n=1 Tax=Fusarium zealandicum TaxID=1053134 RepID=A0A8H4UGW3_9HYPO|nr:hypothetical protein FZEAL_7144 [Fusarium zealandicum]
MLDGSPLPLCPIKQVEVVDLSEIAAVSAALLFADSPSYSPSHDGIVGDDELYIDRILRCGPQDIILCDESTVVKAPDDIVPSSTMSFFSNDRITSLASRLGTDSLRELVENLDDLIKKRVCQKQTSRWDGIDFQKREPVIIQPDKAHAFIQAFFAYIHPVYPFLDRQGFVAQASDVYLDDILQIDPAFSALYYSVLALGSQFFHCGSFVPHTGQAWDLFQVSLGKLSEILAPPVTVVNLQALIGMSIFAMNACCLQLDQTLISEAARMAQALKYHKSSNSDASQLKAFWTVYFMEKLSGFSECQGSLLVDEDIGCVIPAAPESAFGDYDWFTSAIRLARISSIAYSSLFSVSASSKCKAALATATARVRYLLDGWRMSVPPQFRPGEAIRHDDDLTPSTKLVLLQTHYAYYNIVFALERLAIYVDREEVKGHEESKTNLMSAARSVVELIVFVDFEPHLPIFISGIMPLSALFILFDFIIHNPRHTRTEENLVLLDTVSRYFAIVDSISRGALPGSIISEFASIARQFVSSSRQSTVESGSDSFGNTPDHAVAIPSSDWTLDTSNNTDTSLLKYPGLSNNMSNTQMGELKTIFGCVFPDWGDA